MPEHVRSGSRAFRLIVALYLLALLPALAQSAEKLPDLPQRLGKDDTAVRVVVFGVPVPIDDIGTIYVFIDGDMRWTMGPKPEIKAKFADGWVTVDRSMYTLGKPGQKTEIRFTSAGQPMVANGVMPTKGSRRVEYNGSPPEVDFDASVAVAKDEVAGRVVDLEGKPVAGAIVSIPRLELPDKEPMGFRPSVTTDVSGEFRFKDFAHQHYLYFQIDHPGDARRYLADAPLGKFFTIKIDHRTRLAGQLLLSDGKPAGTTTIHLSKTLTTARPMFGGDISDVTQTFTTDADGKYDVPVPPGVYNVRLTAASGQVARHQKIEVAVGQTVALPPTLAPGMVATVRAVDSQTGKPVPNVMFAIEEHRPGLSYFREGTNRKSDADGRATWNNLTAGKERLSVGAEGYSRWWTGDAKNDFRGIDSITLDVKPDMPELVIKMEPAIQVAGRVIDPDGKPVAGAYVNVAGMSTGDMRYARQTDADGRFKLQFPDLTREMGHPDRPNSTSMPGGSGEYAILAFDQSGNWANVLSEPFTPTAGEVKEMTLQMGLGGRVTGRVVDPAGKPVSGIEVEARADDDMDCHYFNPRQVTDANGNFDLGPMRPATYSIQADGNFGVNISNTPQTPMKITIGDGEEQDDLTITYSGPPPLPVPKEYFRYSGNRRITATTRPANRHS